MGAARYGMWPTILGSFLLSISYAQTVTTSHDDPVPAAGFSFKGIAPGVGRSADVQAQLGTPVRGTAMSAEWFRAERAGVVEAVVGYSPEGIVRWAKIVPVKSLSPQTLAIILQLTALPQTIGGSPLGSEEAAGHTEQYPSSGVYLYVENNAVREIWLTIPAESLESLKSAITAARNVPAARDSSPPAATAVPTPAPTTAPSPPTVTVTPNPAPQPTPPANPESRLRRVQLHSISTENVIAPNGTHGLKLMAPLTANGLAGRTMTCTVTLQTLDNKPVLAAPGVDPSLVGPNGILQVTATDPIRFDDATWSPYIVFVPYAAMAPNSPSKMIGSYRATCDSLSSELTFEVAMPVNEAGPPMVFAPQGGDRALQVAGVQFQPDAPTQYGPGTFILVDVTAVNLKGSKLEGFARIRTADGARVSAVRGDTPLWRDPDGSFVCRAIGPVTLDVARWDSLRFLLPYGQLDLPPGRSHRLIIELKFICGSVSESAEMEWIIPAQAGK